MEQLSQLPYSRRSDFKVARATELSGRDYYLYRAFEILPGFLSWSFLLAVILCSIYATFLAAYFIIAFSIYWVLRTAFMSYHVRYNWKRLRHHLELDWKEMVKRFDYQEYYQLIIFPYYNEPEGIIEDTMEALARINYDKQKLIVVLAAEERAGRSAIELGERIKAKWQGKFGHFLLTNHPADIPGELAGKGSNVHHALDRARREILDLNRIPYRQVLTSVFDIDTRVYPDYFNCLVWHFFTAEQPYKSAFQPVPLFTNNLWTAPAVSRVMAMSSTFWQMISQERPKKSATFSSHSTSFQALYEIGYGQPNVVSEDSRIFWNLLIANNGNFKIVPMAYPLEMDATVGRSIARTVINIYKQHRRWSYGTENLSYIFYHFVKNQAIPLKQRLTIAFVQVEGYWSLATNPLILFILGWAPIFLGTEQFHQTVLSYELPILVRNLLVLAMVGLVVSSIISLSLGPKRPRNQNRFKYVVMALQWIMVPITMVIFSSIPGLDAQTRLMLGRYMGFWVTPKRERRS